MGANSVLTNSRPKTGWTRGGQRGHSTIGRGLLHGLPGTIEISPEELSSSNATELRNFMPRPILEEPPVFSPPALPKGVKHLRHRLSPEVQTALWCDASPLPGRDLRPAVFLEPAAQCAERAATSVVPADSSRIFELPNAAKQVTSCETVQVGRAPKEDSPDVPIGTFKATLSSAQNCPLVPADLSSRKVR